MTGVLTRHRRGDRHRVWTSKHPGGSLCLLQTVVPRFTAAGCKALPLQAAWGARSQGPRVRQGQASADTRIPHTTLLPVTSAPRSPPDVVVGTVSVWKEENEIP